MLIDLHANPGDLTPENFATVVADAGLSAVVITRTNRADGLTDYAEALRGVGVDAYFGVELALDKGMVVYIPRTADAAFEDTQWTQGSSRWTVEEVNERLANEDGAIIAAHPYFRDDHPGLGDRVYRVKGLSAIVTRVGRGSQGWDTLAEQAAQKRGLTQLGSSGGDSKFLGAAATVMDDEVTSQSALVDALKSGPTMVLEMDDPSQPRDRRPPARSTPDDRRDRDSRGRGDGRGRRDDRGRGRNNDRRGGRERGRRNRRD